MCIIPLLILIGTYFWIKSETFCNQGSLKFFKPLDSDLVYSHPVNPEITGRNFYGLHYPERLQILKNYLDSEEVELETENKKYPVFLTAASENHFIEHLSTAKILFETYKNDISNIKIVIVDIGLSKDQAKFFKRHKSYKIFC